MWKPTIKLPLPCMCCRPMQIIITHVDRDGNEREEVIGKSSTHCKYCGEPWDKH